MIGPGSLSAVNSRAQSPCTFTCPAESMRFRTFGPLTVPHQAPLTTFRMGGYLIPARALVLGTPTPSTTPPPLRPPDQSSSRSGSSLRQMALTLLR